MTKHHTFMRLLAKKKTRKQRVTLLKKASEEQINAIRNICYDVCSSQIKLDKRTRNLLYPYRNTIRDLSNHKKIKSSRGARNRIIQHGGFLNILLPAVLSLLTSLGSKAIQKAVGV